jgi:Flp pilus assembly protein TadD
MFFFAAASAFGQGGHGRGRLTGTVTDDEGKPVADARVVLRLVEAGDSWYKGWFRSQGSGRSDSAVFETRTDPKGDWVFNGLATALWEVRVSKGVFYGLGVRQVQVRQISNNPPVEIRLDRLKTGSYSIEPGLLEGANAFYAKGEFDRALVAFRGYLEKDPDAILIVLAVGVCLTELGRTEEAVTTFRGAVDSTSADPGDRELCARACSGLAESYLKLGDREQAIEYWKLAVQKSDSSEIPAANLGEILFAAGRSKEALEYYLVAAKIAPEQAALHYKLGLIYANLSDYANARARFAKVVELEPRTGLGRAAKKMIADLAKQRSKRP